MFATTRNAPARSNAPVAKDGKMITKIISGGQTGADRAGLDFAIAHGIPHGGWCPKGRKAEDGRIPDCYNLRETPSEEYPPRTALNIKEADATLIFNPGDFMERGSALTIELCISMGKPWWLYHGQDDAVEGLRAFLAKHQPKVLNVAGNRASKRPGINRAVKRVLAGALGLTPP